MAVKKTLFEGFAKFFERPSRQALRDLLKHSIGETDQFEFKVEWPEKPKLVKHILAMANSGGGALVIGVEDGKEMRAAGLSSLTDKSDIEKKTSPYLPMSLEYEVLDFSFTDSEYEAIKGLSFQVLIVESDVKELPYICKRSGDGVKDSVIYIRRGTNSTEANHDEVQRVINARLDTGYSSSRILDLEEHLRQLKTLYEEIPKNFTRLKGLGGVFLEMNNVVGSVYESTPNPDYPKENYEQFILRLIEDKKTRIQQELDL